ncbi:MAG: hypothetical protein ACO1N5_06440 [Noviherbaspirillum sp.]
MIFRKMVKNTEYPGYLAEEKILGARRRRQAGIAAAVLLCTGLALGIVLDWV